MCVTLLPRCGRRKVQRVEAGASLAALAQRCCATSKDEDLLRAERRAESEAGPEVEALLLWTLRLRPQAGFAAGRGTGGLRSGRLLHFKKGSLPRFRGRIEAGLLKTDEAVILLPSRGAAT
jgi:hypothetical protein